jgi:hypothetical protein
VKVVGPAVKGLVLVRVFGIKHGEALLADAADASANRERSGEGFVGGRILEAETGRFNLGSGLAAARLVGASRTHCHRRKQAWQAEQAVPE